MADFTINSRAKTAVAQTDSFLKSDENGALTRATAAEIDAAINGNTNISSIGDGTVKGAIAAMNQSLKAFTVLAQGNVSVQFTDGVGEISVDLSEFDNIVNKFTILGVFNTYPLEFGVVGGITNDTLSTYTWKLRTVGSTATRTTTIRYCILGKVA